MCAHVTVRVWVGRTVCLFFSLYADYFFRSLMLMQRERRICGVEGASESSFSLPEVRPGCCHTALTEAWRSPCTHNTHKRVLCVSARLCPRKQLGMKKLCWLVRVVGLMNRGSQWLPCARACSYIKIITRPCSVISSSLLACSSAVLMCTPPPTNRCIQVPICVRNHLKWPCAGEAGVVVFNLRLQHHLTLIRHSKST